MSKYFKKCLSVFLVVLMIVSLFSFSSFAATSGSCGNGVYWNYNQSSNTLTINGTGAMYDYIYYEIPWREHQSNIDYVVVNYGVTYIGEYAFYGMSGLYSIKIPDTVKEIAELALSASNIKTIEIGSGLEKIEGAFDRTCMGSFVVSESNPYYKSIDGALFNKDATTLIKYNGYYSNTKTEYTVPSTVKTIESDAFYNCDYLEKLTIPTSVTSISEKAISRNYYLKEVSVSSSNSYYSSSDGVLFDKNKTNLILYPQSKASSSYTVPSTVKKIYSEAFCYAKNLVNITIPDTVERIGKDAFNYTGYYNNSSNWTDDVLYIGNHLIKAKLLEVTSYSIKSGTKTIADEAIYNQDYLTSLTIPSTVTVIGDRAISYCYYLTKITIPSSVKIIGDGAFEGCQTFTSVTIPSSVTSMGKGVFADCFSLKTITVNSSNQYYSSSNGVLFNKSKTTLLCYPYNINTTSYTIPSTVRIIDDYAFHYSYLKEITIPSGVTTIGKCAFNASRITSVTIPSTVTLIDECAFQSCDYMEDIIISEGLTEIGEYAFNYCTSLKRATLPYSLKKIGSAAFLNCSSLKNIIYGGTQEDWKNITIKGNNRNLNNMSISYHTHTPGSSSVMVNPTCTTTGIRSSECTSCKRTLLETIPAINHESSQRIVIDSSLYVESSHNYKNNSYETKTFTYEDAASLELTFSTQTMVEEDYDYIILYDMSGNRIGTYTGDELSGKTIKVPGNGFKIILDSDDSVNKYGYSFTSIVACKSAFGSWQSMIDATCSSKGIEKRKCSLCNLEETREIPVLEHTYIDHDGKSPSCTESGYEAYRTCQNCNFSSYKVISATGHTEVVDEAVASDCTNTGLTEGKHCSVCNEVIVAQEKIDVLGHSWDEGTTVDELTCEVDGSVLYTCGRCGETKTEVTYAKGHIFAEAVKENEVSGTCTTDGSYDMVVYCSVCNAQVSRETINVPTTGHTEVIDKAVAATCTKTGLTEGSHCSTCGEVIAAQKIVAKKDHNYKTTTTKATLSKNGKSVTKCTVCGYTSKTTTIYYPKTFSLSTTAYTYNGKAKTPTVTVKDSKGNTLKKDTDYTVKYESGRKVPGKYTVTITFKGKYSGTKKLYFTIAPKAPTKLTASQTTTSIKLSWVKVTGATGYRVYKYNTKTKKYEKLKDVTATSLTISKLSAGTKYKFKVKAYTKDEDTIYSAYSSVFETATKPATPTLKVTSASKSKATLTWKNVSGESGYQVYYSTKKDSGFKLYGTAKADVTKATVSKLTSGKTYYFRVRAFVKTDSGTVYGGYKTVAVKVK